MTLKESISFNSNQNFMQPGGITLYQTSSLKFSRRKKYYTLNSLNWNILQKSELVTFMQYARTIFRLEPYISLLISPGEGSNVDIDSWALLTKVKFEKSRPLKIAFVAKGLYQRILLKRLQILNANIKVFSDKKEAVRWLQRRDKIN